MNQFKAWIRLHPFKALVIFAFAVISGIVMATDSVAIGLLLLVLTLGGFVLVYEFDKPLSLILAASLLAVPRTQAQQRVEPAAPLVIGGIVIIIGAGLGFVGCKAIKACKKIAKGRTNAPPEELFLPAGEAPEYGALFTWPEPGDCYAQRLLPSTPTVFTMCPVIDGSETRTLVHADVGFEFVESWGEFTEDMERHGLFVPGSPVLSSCYERGGHPCESQQCPITFNATNHVATIGAGGILVTVEKSEDLKTWEPLLSVNVEPGMNLRFEDASEDKAFYRVTTREAL